MGGRNGRDLSNDDRSDIEAINMAIKEGIIHIDTAESYANGHSEELIAEAIKENNINREDLFIVSKVHESNQGYNKEDVEKLRNEFPNQIYTSDVVPLG